MKPAAERPERLAEEFKDPPAGTVLHKLGKSTFGKHLIKEIAASMRERLEGAANTKAVIDIVSELQRYVLPNTTEGIREQKMPDKLGGFLDKM
eukprot:14494098-Alexandrium_andersonii.AAC.1